MERHTGAPVLSTLKIFAITGQLPVNLVTSVRLFMSKPDEARSFAPHPSPDLRLVSLSNPSSDR